MICIVHAEPAVRNKSIQIYFAHWASISQYVWEESEWCLFYPRSTRNVSLQTLGFRLGLNLQNENANI